MCSLSDSVDSRTDLWGRLFISSFQKSPANWWQTLQIIARAGTEVPSRFCHGVWNEWWPFVGLWGSRPHLWRWKEAWERLEAMEKWEWMWGTHRPGGQALCWGGEHAQGGDTMQWKQTGLCDVGRGQGTRGWRCPCPTAALLKWPQHVSDQERGTVHSSQLSQLRIYHRSLGFFRFLKPATLLDINFVVFGQWAQGMTIQGDPQLGFLGALSVELGGLVFR